MGSQCAQRVVDCNLDNPMDGSTEDCCHLEGETPIEIRIRPPAYARGGRAPSATGAAGSPPLVMPMMRTRHGVVPVPEAEKPPMPIGVPSRFPPPAGVGTPRRSEDDHGFDGDAFAEPSDCFRGSPGLMQDPAVLQMLNAWSSEQGHYPEIVRATRRGLNGSVVREASPDEDAEGPDTDLQSVPM
mmetsp:Transcript_30329/g.67982  ORF Transcript_30329/g.67982 Transcript_30329/m.67982 type:complete len:185 (-) Transcript_30329:78-632(-)